MSEVETAQAIVGFVQTLTEDANDVKFKVSTEIVGSDNTTEEQE